MRFGSKIPRSPAIREPKNSNTGFISEAISSTVSPYAQVGKYLYILLVRISNKRSCGDSLASTRIFLEFARELRKLVEDFEEEMEVLAKKELIEQIRENRREKEKGNTVTFDNLEDLEKELEL
jgi:hypothetical protein